ncbi:hypothetical protein HOO65_010351 [Ceratocystis lukuohia]|uniref:DNA (cytosine-5-)-methyltransferase n=1 Tax=Ceratocystis lukuohia TaxID=2019550 RepID=A0ABR4MRT2_9PEZI
MSQVSFFPRDRPPSSNAFSEYENEDTEAGEYARSGKQRQRESTTKRFSHRDTAVSTKNRVYDHDGEDSSDNDDVTFLLENWKKAEEELEQDAIEFTDVEEYLGQFRRLSRSNEPIAPLTYLDRIVWFEHVLTPGTTVEVSGFDSQRYVRISQIIQGHDGVVLRGVQYVHLVDMQGMLPWSAEQHRNEVCAVHHVDLDDARDEEIQAAVEVPLKSVTDVLILKTSNALWPIHATANDELICRWKFVQYFPSARVRERHLESYSLYQGLEAALVRNNESDADPDCRVSTETLRRIWAEKIRIPGGSYISPTPGNPESREHPNNREPRQDNTKRRLPGQNYEKNFGQVNLFRMKIDEWICRSAPQENSDNIESRTRFQCDVLHLSPPCQVFSPAHTINSQEKDEANFAALFSCEAIIARVKPRVLTFEQTFGLLHRHWRPVFNNLIASFTRYGYAVRWKYVFLPEWGLPARRKRLIVIGAAPGEPLPTFPPPTHSDRPWETGLLPLVTVRQALGKLNLQRDDPLHRPREMKRKNMPRWNNNNILTRCVTTSGGQNYHYSGKRCFTTRELALLQGFPMYHEFVGGFRTRQIGNAFPPCAAAVLFKHIEKCLLAADGVTVDEGDRILADAMAIELDDEDEGSPIGDDDLDFTPSGEKGEGGYNDYDGEFSYPFLFSRQEYLGHTDKCMNTLRPSRSQPQSRQCGKTYDLTQNEGEDSDEFEDWRQMLEPDALAREQRRPHHEDTYFDTSKGTHENTTLLTIGKTLAASITEAERGYRQGLGLPGRQGIETVDLTE